MKTSQCLHAAFRMQFERAPRALAVTVGDRNYTYAELEGRANSIAQHLRSLGVRRDSLVALSLERGFEMIAAILGILKAGGAYVPVDPASPAERIKLVLGDSGAKVLLTTSGVAAQLWDLPGVELVVLDRDVASGPAKIAPEDMSEPSDAAYVIYTSGSTGVPKGVVVEHRHVTRLFTATSEWFGFDSSDVWTMFHSFAFDFSVWELWGALAYGGRLVIVPQAVTRAPDAFYELLERERVTVLNQTPSAFLQLSRVDELSHAPRQLSLRHVIFGGEALDPRSLRGWVERHGIERPRLVNMYGITETTVHVTYHRIQHSDLDRAEHSPIGVPIGDLSVHLLDERGEPVPPGETGEIYVGGAGVARGYLNRPELNQQRFIPDRFSDVPGARLYRSGDLARRLRDGSLTYVGRIDDQVKLRGFRVELGEVESCLRRSPLVSNVAVLVRDHGGGDKSLVAYAEAGPTQAARKHEVVEQLRALCKDHLPDYMRPASFIVLDTFPLTANGKLNRALLPAEQAPTPTPAPAAQPGTDIEKALADIWRTHLGVTNVGVDDDFFELGGTSLGAIKLLLAVHEKLGAALDMSVWAKHSTIAGLASVVQHTRRSAASAQ